MASTVVTADPNNCDIPDFVVNQGNGVKGLSDISLKELPKQYIQPPEERIIVDNEEGVKEAIPIIDMSKWDDPKVVESICEAAAKWGFFMVVNHGIPLEVLENMKMATSRFFVLPVEEKRKYSKQMSPSESVTYGPSFSPEAENALEWKDYLRLVYVSEEEASALWPPICKDQTLEYLKRSESLASKLLEALMKGLNVSLDNTKESLLRGLVHIVLNYYPICPNPELAVGHGRHSDVSTLTILLQDDVGGLYVRGSKDDWIYVPPIDGSLVINIGDALQIMSNGRYKSAEHRVAVNRTENRISVPIFVLPKAQAMIGPFPELLASGEKANYKEIMYSDYLRHFLNKRLDGKKTLDFVEI